MKIVKEETSFGTNIIFEEDDKFIKFWLGGNLDLYWSIHRKNKDINNDTTFNSFTITKENYDVYRLFEKLFDDIENINIFDCDDDSSLDIEDEEDIKRYREERRKHMEEDKKRCRLFNHSHYNDLFDSNSRTITWYSDETAYEVANYLKIKQEDDIFKLEFYIQPHKQGYGQDFHSDYYIPIRFSNSGSLYNPFNFIFMRMYNNMVDIEDVNDFGHQIHIEEYIHEKEKKVQRLSM